MQVTRELFEQQRRPRFGNTNPERMEMAFWEWMIRGEEEGDNKPSGPLEEAGLVMRDGKLKSTYGPTQARDRFNVMLNCEDGPIWTFDRMGASRTELQDGRLICIGGEHEDFYDPDFCIYNDVVVFRPGDEIEIYGYPETVFPPTDFHTATLWGDEIIVIGGLGYQNERRPQHTPVYGLRLADYSIHEAPTHGTNPGWIFKHKALRSGPNTVRISGGETFLLRGGKGRLKRNIEDFSLDLESGEWRQLTTRNWRQYTISRTDGRMFAGETYPKAEKLIPPRFANTISEKDWNSVSFMIKQVPVTVTVNVQRIEILVAGQVPADIITASLEQILALATEFIQYPCTVEEI